MYFKKIKLLSLSLMLSPMMLLAANVDIPLNSPIYEEIDRLETLGQLGSLVTTSKPYNTTELEKAINEISDPHFAKDKEALLAEISRYNRSGIIDIGLDAVLARKQQSNTNQGGVTTSDSSAFFSNNDGLRLDNGANVKLQGRSQYILGENVSIVTTPNYTNSGNKEDVGVDDTYARVNASNVNLTVGKEALWIGVGKGGTIVLGNNAKPITMARVSNIVPFEILPDTLPWLSHVIGKVDGDIFVGRLDEQENILGADGIVQSGYPKIFGMQLSFKPHQNFQWGVYRTALFGGGNRAEGFDTFMDVFWPDNDVENISALEPGDQKAGAFASLNVPNEIQSFKIYAEIAGEDAAGMTPSKPSYIAGVKLVDLVDIRGLSANYEYFGTDDSDAWYRHHIYRDGYTNDGLIMGHPHGGQGFSHYINTTYQPSLDKTISLAYAYDRYDNDFYANSITASWRERIGKKYELSARAGYTQPSDESDNYYAGLGFRLLFLSQ